MPDMNQPHTTKPPFDSRQLRAFTTLARTGSFSQTGKEMFLTQSAISHAMKALERDAGCRLFDKVGKTIVLTQAGEHLLYHADKILREMGEARDGLEHLGKWGKGRLRLGASSTACQHILPAVLREFKESFPECQITIDPGDSLQLLRHFEQNRIELALCLEPRNEKAFEAIPLFSDELFFIVSPMHPWAKAKSVDREDVARQNYILYTRNSQTFRMIEDHFREEDLVLHSFIELGNIEAIMEMVKLGIGISILPEWVAREELEEGSLARLPLGRRKLKRHWCLLHRKNRRLTLAEETFAGLCRSVAETMALKTPSMTALPAGKRSRKAA